ncbi:hypothetical protein CICLE_v10024425mg [Citrus x clementina]|uniref:Large ribosomal subunit protein uL2 C-terminal domain-containing protein n=2 Tax=Citrus TaxID=2706 RepID=V4T542_CITCL|nr:hypothetical protein CICLE_v10024425mg [Citrus x clementina]GAY63345.1 hypothetical protein CUMW_224780 [Citrus unshiu]
MAWCKICSASSTLLKKPKKDTAREKVMRQMPCGNEKLIDTRCGATVGTVSNPSHGAKKLSKAGQRCWLGRGAVFRGVAMIPVDHPHVGRSKSSGNNGRCSLTP